jgi:hypothetical protein
MLAVVVLAIIALALIKSLMSVVARDEAASVPPWSPDFASTTDPTMELRATANDDAFGLLLPAAPTDAESEPTVVSEQTRQPQSERSTRW